MNIGYEVWGLVGLTLATGLVAGVFLTFSDFVMKSLAASQPAAGTEAMQIINRKVYQSFFMILLVGLIPISVIVAIGSRFYLPDEVANILMVGGGLYFFGVFVVSAVGNIPMNKKLEAMPQAGAEAQAYWPDYIRGWVLWNHIRWLAALGASACYLISAISLT